jgi:hypothetical protein
MILLSLCLVAVGILNGAQARAADADPPQAEPTLAECESAVAHARDLAATLPADHLSRYFAERYLHQAMIEAGNGEFDDCLEFTERAVVEVKELRHTLRPGETLKVLRADE